MVRVKTRNECFFFCHIITTTHLQENKQFENSRDDCSGESGESVERGEL